LDKLHARNNVTAAPAEIQQGVALMDAQCDESSGFFPRKGPSEAKRALLLMLLALLSKLDLQV